MSLCAFLNEREVYFILLMFPFQMQQFSHTVPILLTNGTETLKLLQSANQTGHTPAPLSLEHSGVDMHLDSTQNLFYYNYCYVA